LKRVRVISLSCFVGVFPKDILQRLHPITSRGPSENSRIPILKDKRIRLIKGARARLENLLVGPCPIREEIGKEL